MDGEAFVPMDSLWADLPEGERRGFLLAVWALTVSNRLAFYSSSRVAMWCTEMQKGGYATEGTFYRSQSAMLRRYGRCEAHGGEPGWAELCEDEFFIECLVVPRG